MLQYVYMKFIALLYFCKFNEMKLEKKKKGEIGNSKE